MKIKKWATLAILTVGLVVGVASAAAAGTASIGGIYTEIVQPQAVGGAQITTAKRVEVSTYGILGMLAFGDANLELAARRGGITKISHIEKKTFGILQAYGLFRQETFIIYGE